MKRLYTEEDVQRALEDIANGKSVRKASLDWSPLRDTLEGRIKGHVSRSKGAAPLQKLSLIQEQRLTDWVLVQESLGLSPTHMQIRVFASWILAAWYDRLLLGKKWMAGFLRRNLVLKTKKQFRIDSARVNSATSDILEAWFQKLEIPAINEPIDISLCF